MKKEYYEIVKTEYLVPYKEGVRISYSQTIAIVTDEDVAKDFCNSNSHYEYITHTFEVKDE